MLISASSAWRESRQVCCTGVHALHLAVALGLVAWRIRDALRRPLGTATEGRFDATGLYRHFVDVVRIFLYPMRYLLERHR